MSLPTKSSLCPSCNGTGKAVYSCCTGEIVTGDILICPKCKEHLGEEVCQQCGGTGEDNGEEAPDKVDPQLQLERQNYLLERV